MAKELLIIAPPFLYLPGSGKKNYLSFNNYHSWPIHVRTALRRAYSAMVQSQVSGLGAHFNGDVECTVTTHQPKDGRVRDTDDHCFLHAKWANDALKEAGVWKDDTCVLNVHMIAGAHAKVPHVTIAYKYLHGREDFFKRPESPVTDDDAMAVQPETVSTEHAVNLPVWGKTKPREFPKKRSPRR